MENGAKSPKGYPYTGTSPFRYFCLESHQQVLDISPRHIRPHRIIEDCRQSPLVFRRRSHSVTLCHYAQSCNL